MVQALPIYAPTLTLPTVAALAALWREVAARPLWAPPHFWRYLGLRRRMHLRLLDLARFFARREKAGLRPDDPRDPEDSSVRSGPQDMRTDDPDELEKWCHFHEEVEKLPVQEREVVSLIYYHGWKQAEIANLFDIAERTVRRRWESAMIHLRDTFIQIE